MQKAKYINIARTQNRQHRQWLMKPWIALLVLLFAFISSGSTLL